MPLDKLKLLREISDKIVSDMKEHRQIITTVEKYAGMEEICSDADLMHILTNIKCLSECAVENEILSLIGQRVTHLSADEKAELNEVNRIIDNNLFDYHFQPIINARDGSIYSFEALMRPKSDVCKSPMRILKYAEITGRLAEIEKATFINILKLIDENGGMIGDKPIFINSIPKVRLDKNDLSTVMPLLTKYSDNVVVEMTEQSEMSESDLDSIRKMYEAIGIQLAIDDYGTGYSNVQNLIRYTPDYVKIDRSLIGDVDKDHRKQHFVREIIDFCHDNNIMALAEGVETQEELHTVISLGVDLIQGFYTAKPCAGIIEALPEEIRDEIKNCREEYDRDKSIGIYRANNIDKVRLDHFDKDKCNCIVIGDNTDNTMSNIILTGHPQNLVHVVIKDNYSGELILENAELSNSDGKPCISIGENCSVRLVLKGGNKLIGGIRVPETSDLIISGDGALKIWVDGSGFYGIGNDGDSRHGKLTFEQGVTIVNDSSYGVCIGAGLGGDIDIKAGKFELAMRGMSGVAMGSFKGDSFISIDSCDVQLDSTLQRGIGIGSLDGNSDIRIKHSSVKAKISGNDIIGFGTFKGDACRVTIDEASTLIDINSDDCSAIAAMRGKTALSITKANLQILTKGIKTYAIGYLRAPASISIRNAEFKANIVTNPKFVSTLREGNLITIGGRVNVTVNGEEFYYSDH